MSGFERSYYGYLYIIVRPGKLRDNQKEQFLINNGGVRQLLGVFPVY